MSVNQIIGSWILANPLEGILFSIFALIVGIISSSLGVGGGFITTPSLIILGIEEAFAIGTVLIVIIFMAISSTIAYSRQPERIQYRMGLLIAIFTSIGAVLGSITSSILATEAPDIFRVLFVLCLVPVAIKMIFFPKQKKESDSQEEIEDEIGHNKVIFWDFEQREVFSSILGLIVGLFAGLLGIGGGVLMVPILVVVGKLSMHKAVATSVFIMIFTSIAGATVKMSTGQIHPDLAIFLIFGIVIGAQIGPLIVKKINTKRLQQVFGIIMLIALLSIAIGRDFLIFLLQTFFNLPPS
ncbi:MAG: sulfite exporter TauE/SafE family protein [Candidatus Hodarchaeales archaeon]|jgi:uncharacterized membrane protein YfcA